MAADGEAVLAPVGARGHAGNGVEVGARVGHGAHRTPSRRERRRDPAASCTFRPVPKVSNDELIAAAVAVLNPHLVGDRLFGDVAAALVTDIGTQFVGVCIDTGSGTGFCAEHAAIAGMITAGEYRIARIVAVWRDEHDALYVLPPCGRCREFIRQVDDGNIDTEVVLGRERSAALAELLPEHEWPAPLGSGD